FRTIWRHLKSILFHYTTLFRSRVDDARIRHALDWRWRGLEQQPDVRRHVDFHHHPEPVERPDQWLSDHHVVGDSERHRRSRLLRSEEHTSELQSREKLVCRLLL